MKEAIFITEVKRSIFKYGGWAYKLADMPQSMLQGARFNPEKPCDLVASINGKFVGIECKQLRKYEAFGLRHIRETQVRGLNGIIHNGLGRSFIFLNIRQKADKERGIKRLNHLIIFDWDKWRHLWEGRTTKKHELLTVTPIPGKNGMFPLHDWVMNF